MKKKAFIVSTPLTTDEFICADEARLFVEQLIKEDVVFHIATTVMDVEDEPVVKTASPHEDIRNEKN